ncbi:beta-propeller uncharacterized protein DUF5122 [Solirubrobacter pauli]|uniref:Beta-propeller uncharacterized protein DUF5122 n=1 Tax=Solirubrobacter pauli TaxID=166793 RepID=A0A660L8B0_9ACTN|nr:hypothetical protein [Solirubrobacter pauli]RKQ88153.1 beta-propeller uncharacterized protein DUF5122 [Solirubrobacter pauli]
MKVIAVGAAASLLLLAAPAHARPGALDRTFAQGGRFALDPWGSGGTVKSLALLDGRRPLLSVHASRDGTWAPTLLGFTAAGALAEKTALPPRPYAPRFASGYALTQLDAKHFQLARIGSTSAVTLTFAPRFEEPLRFTVDRAGRAILAGADRVARFLPSGEPDRTYGTNGIARAKGFWAALIRRDGRVYMQDNRRIIAFDARGRRDRRFGTRRVRVPGFKWPDLNTVHAGPGNTLLVTGRRYLGDAWIGRLRGDGRVDLRFGTRGYVSGLKLQAQLQIADVARDRRGRLVVVGAQLGQEEEPARSVVLRLSANGRLDRTFANRRFTLGRVPGVKIVASGIEQVAIDDRGRIVLAGNVYNDQFALREDLGDPYPAIARLKG